jgi:hypothetical protein
MPARRGQVEEDRLIGPAALERVSVGELKHQKPVGRSGLRTEGHRQQ